MHNINLRKCPGKYFAHRPGHPEARRFHCFQWDLECCKTHLWLAISVRPDQRDAASFTQFIDKLACRDNASSAACRHHRIGDKRNT
jgi:hypothetical protein